MFVVNTPKGQVRLMDLPLSAFEPIEKDAGIGFLRIIQAPAATSSLAIAVYRAACEHIGAEPEELTPKDFVGSEHGIFELDTDEDPDSPAGDPDEMTLSEGIPKADTDQATSSSPGSQSTKGGRRRKSESAPTGS